LWLKVKRFFAKRESEAAGWQMGLKRKVTEEIFKFSEVLNFM
jgi:hypothetical protein